LRLSRYAAVGLALDGQSFKNVSILETHERQLCAFEATLRMLGYQLQIFSAERPPSLRGIPYNENGNRELRESLPRRIALAEISPAACQREFARFARIKQYYSTTNVISLTGLSNTLVGLLRQPPSPFTTTTVAYAMDVIPLLQAAHTRLPTSYLPLLTGYSRRLTLRMSEGGPDTALDHHVVLYAHLGLQLRIDGPAGLVTIQPRVNSVQDSVLQIDAVREERSAEASRLQAKKAAEATPAKTPRRPGVSESRLSREEIIERLQRDVPVLAVAKAAGLTHQRIYAIMREEGMSVREQKSKVASAILTQLPKARKLI